MKAAINGSVDSVKLKIPFLGSVNVGGSIEGASGSAWDCCLDGEIKEKGYQKAELSGEITVNGSVPTPLSANLDFNTYKVLEFKVSGSGTVGIDTPLQFTIDASGNYKKECDGKTCYDINGTAKAVLKAKAVVEAEITVELPNETEPRTLVEVSFQPVTLKGGLQGTVSYNSCANDTWQGNLCALPVIAVADPTITVVVAGFEWEVTTIPGVDKKIDYRLWDGTCQG